MIFRRCLTGFVIFFWPLLAASQVGTGDESGTSPLDSNIQLNAGDVLNVQEESIQKKPETVPEDSKPNDKRTLAKKAYDNGKRLTEKGDFIRARNYFERALKLIRLPIILYAAAQCRKDLGDDIEALILFKEALKVNSDAGRRFDRKDRLTDIETEIAFENMKDLLKRYVQLEIVIDDEDKIDRMTVNGEKLVTIHISTLGENPNKDTAGDATGKHNDSISVDIGLSSRSLSELGTAAGDREFIPTTFWTKPGVYDFEIFLKSGPRVFLKKHSIVARKNTVDLMKKSWPGRVVIENVPAKTQIVLTDMIHHTTTHDVSYTVREREVEISDLKPGKYNLVATRKGYLDFKMEITLNMGRREQVYLDFTQKPFYKKWPFWVGVALVSAAIVGITVPLIRSRQDDPPGSGTVHLDETAKIATGFYF